MAKKQKPLKRTPLKKKEYNPEDFKNKEYKTKKYKKKEYKIKDYRELKKREPKPFVQLTPKEAFLKLAAFCAYQERCHKEIYEKLAEWKIDEGDHYAIITLLEEENFLSEKRFAESYVRGKFNYKKWGRKKIRYGLVQKDISEKVISDALASEIDKQEYFSVLYELLEKKWSDLLEKEDDAYKRKVKATNYGLQKGYEAGLIREILSDF
ncbi:regulatory protein RecX [Bernardetia sp.]|uniref:regulatory protein RecX n=1 Tax=Bernardetia sp. TaxID=1937974 RepID=UPI0025BE0907|nr:regulatory protein RecX [Bernardetia sp.]